MRRIYDLRFTIYAVVALLALLELTWLWWPEPDYQEAGPQLSAAWTRATNSDQP